MSRDIPFFEMFTELQLSGELRLRLAGAVLTGAVIDREKLSITAHLTVRNPLTEEEQASLKQTLAAVYGFRSVELVLTVKEEAHASSVSAPGAPAEKKSGKILMGKAIKSRPGPMKDLNLKMGNATVEGKVFAFECRETRRPGMWRLSFDMTDYTNSVTVQKNLTTKEAQQLECPDGHQGGGEDRHPLGPSRHRHHGPRRGPVFPGCLARLRR